ncbi:MAG: hypothetical protein ACXABU_08550 [Candidatus Hodarchaeales archaeon]
MGIEESLKQILDMNVKIFQTLQQSQDVSQIRTELESSIQNFSDVALAIDAKFQESARTIIRHVQESYEGLNPELLASIAQLPPVLATLEASLSEIETTFKNTEVKIKEDLRSIRAAYVEDVLGRMNTLAESISESVSVSTEKTSNLYEASITQFVQISEDLKTMESHLNSLIENQTDQLATVAELRDRVSAIIQVELASLRDHININLENSVNELKTSVTERLMVQDGTIQRLSQAVEGLNQSVSNLPEVIKGEINLAVDTKLISTIEKMEKENKKTTALVVGLIRKLQDGS